MHRHGYKGRKFGRERDQRRALLKGLATSLVIHGKIETTLPKAKETLRYTEKLITKAKKGDLHNRRQVMAKLGNIDAANKLVDIIAPQLSKRNSGHLRIERTRIRRGDAAQMATIEFARNVLKLENANSEEFDTNTKNPVIHLIQEQENVDHMGASMRLGAYPCVLKENSIVREAYNQEVVNERHRHRYEFNMKYRDLFEKNGFVISGISPDNNYVETIEIPEHPFFVATQYHPEFKSRPNKPHPLFKAWIKAIIDKKGIQV